jgi:hypothetical protein
LQIMSDITLQPAEWVLVNATSAAARRRRSLAQAGASPITLRSQVHATEGSVASVQPRVEAAVQDGSLASQLQGIGLTLVQDSGGCGVHGCWLAGARACQSSSGGGCRLMTCLSGMLGLLDALEPAGNAPCNNMQPPPAHDVQ